MRSKASLSSYIILVMSTLSETVKRQVDVLLDECFSVASGKATAEHRDKFCSGKDIFGHVMAMEKDTVIGVTRVLKRKVLFEGIPLILGGVGGMCTRKDRRRLGVGSSMLTASMQELRKASCDIAYLCTNVNKHYMVDFYRNVGFVPLGRQHTYLGKSGKRYTDADAMIAPVNSEKKFLLVRNSATPLDIGVGNW